LDAAHEKGVIHGDLKPQNILVDSADNAYVSDFGLTKSLEEGAATVTGMDAVLGTRRYMSPEQLQGQPPDHRSDIYSLGLIVYEMITGERPFKGDSAFRVTYQRVTQKPKSPKEVKPVLPDYLARIVLHCLDRDPGHRYQQARDVLLDLEREAAPTPWPRPKMSFPMPARGARLVAASAVLALTIIVVVVAGSSLRRPSRHGPPLVAAQAGIPPLHRANTWPYSPCGYSVMRGPSGMSPRV
jgi:serine/threonine-protein kinase